MRHSLVWRIAVPIIVLVLLSVGGISLYYSNYIENQYMSNVHASLASAARLLAYDSTEEIKLGRSYDDLKPLISIYAQQTNARVTFIRRDGVVTIDSEADPATMDNHLDRPEIQTALDDLEGVEIRFSDTLKRRFFYLAVPVKSEGQITAVVRFARDLTDIEGAVAQIHRRIFGMGAGIILFTVLLAYLIAENSLQPLRKLAKNVNLIREGNTQVDLSSNRHDEIGQLSHSIAEVADQLNLQVEDFREERGKLEAVLRHMTDAVLIVNIEGRVSLINPAAERLFKTSSELALNSSLVEVVRHFQLVDLWKNSVETAKQQVSTLETSPDRLFVQVIATPLESSLPGSTLLVFQDLTRVRRLETIRQDFISNVSHELRTPLASLKALVETLQGGAIDEPPAAARFLQRMEVEIDNLTQTVQELLELSRIESGRVPFAKKPVAPQELITNAIERMQHQAERSGLKIEIEGSLALPEVLADADRIGSVLVNLIHNAIKFTQPGGKITVTALAEAGNVIFSVMDTGVGIAPQDLPRIFERFYKADQSRSGGGTGLGLSIARHIVEAHQGQIWAKSMPGEGSTFNFSLPQA